MIFIAHFDDQPHEIKIVEDEKGYRVAIDQKEPFHIDVVEQQTGSYSVLYQGRAYEFDVESKETQYNVLVRGKLYSLELINQKTAAVKAQELVPRNLVARMPGKIIKIMVGEGDTVSKHQGLIIMEAMKMENELKAPAAGRVKTIQVKEGENVDTGEILIIFE